MPEIGQKPDDMVDAILSTMMSSRSSIHVFFLDEKVSTICGLITGMEEILISEAIQALQNVLKKVKEDKESKKKKKKYVDSV